MSELKEELWWRPVRWDREKLVEQVTVVGESEHFLKIKLDDPKCRVRREAKGMASKSKIAVLDKLLSEAMLREEIAARNLERAVVHRNKIIEAIRKESV